MNPFKPIVLDAPNLSEEDARSVYEAVRSGFVSSSGPKVTEFEKAMAAFLGCPDAVAVQSGTAAMHLALVELGLGPGDEVVVPAVTFIATANVVRYVGATPVLADVRPDTWTLAPEAVEAAINARTKAIIPVHLFGVPCHMDQIMEIAEHHGLYVIEDACEALGATFGHTPVGCIGDIGSFSFNGNKIMTTGGGGLVVARKQARLDHIRFISQQAKDNHEYAFYHPEVGFNYRMTNIAAALGLVQLRRLPNFIEKKQRINELYREELEGTSRISFQAAPEQAEPVWWMTAVQVLDCKPKELVNLMTKLSAQGIQTRRLFTPLYNLPPFNMVETPTTIADRLFSSVLCLPSSTLLDDDHVRNAARALKEALGS